MKKFLGAMLVAACSLASASAAHAITLNGDTIDVNMTSFSDHGTQTVLVGAGEDTNYFGNQFFDFNAGAGGDIFTIRSGSNFCGITCTSQPVTITLSNLDFDVPLTSISILSSIGGAFVSSFTQNSIVFQWADVNIPKGVYFQAQFNGNASPVPLPATLPLLLAALGGLGALRVFRKA